MAFADNISNFLQTAKNQFAPNIYERFYRTNPFASMQKRGVFDPSRGLTQQVITTTHELPTAYPTGLTSLALSTGTGNTPCNPAATVIKSGNKNASYVLKTVAFESDPLCVTDLDFAHNPGKQVANKEKGLAEYVNVWWSDFQRIANLSMALKKYSTRSTTSIGAATSNSNESYTGISVPTVGLNWSLLDQVRDSQLRIGAGVSEYSWGMTEDGEAALGLIIGPGIARMLFRDDDIHRTAINYFDPKSNLKALGYNKAINGFIPIIDMYPIRYGADLAAPIYPTINADTTNGRESLPNPDYLTVANGGQALYEVVTIKPRNTFEIHVRQSSPSSYGGLKFDPQSYVGDFNVINNKDNVNNKLGNIAYFRADIQAALYPIATELGGSILTLARD